MAKKETPPVEQDETFEAASDLPFDFLQEHEGDYLDPDAMVNMAQTYLNANATKISNAIDLTKLVLKYSDNENREEDDVFNVFKKSLETIDEVCPMPDFMPEDMG